jgi:hypothetical protein
MSRIWEERYEWAVAEQNTTQAEAIQQYFAKFDVLDAALIQTEHITTLMARLRPKVNRRLQFEDTDDTSLEDMCFVKLANFMPSQLLHIQERWLDRLPRASSLKRRQYRLVPVGGSHNEFHNTEIKCINTAFDPRGAGVIQCMAAIKDRLMYIYSVYRIGEDRFDGHVWTRYAATMAELENLQLFDIHHVDSGNATSGNGP